MIYAIYHKGKLYGQTSDLDQYEFLMRLYTNDGCNPADLKVIVYAKGEPEENYNRPTTLRGKPT